MSLCPENDPCLSLPRAIFAIAKRRGLQIDFDELVAAMGLGWLVCAVPGHLEVGDWMMHARDAFLVPACKLFGINLREIHPPDAAKGLDRAAEFAQHFDASYRPLIVRALENNQPVLAWRGWPERYRLHWGEIDGQCKEGIGLSGQVYAHLDQVGERLTMICPPTQVYVIEEIQPVEVNRQALYQLVSRHIEQIGRQDLQRRFGVVTGQQAFDLWRERLNIGEFQDAVGHAQFHASVISCHKIAQRWLEKNAPA